MKGICTNDEQFFDQNDYPHQLRQNNIFIEWYKTGIHQNNWYVVGICEQKRPYGTYCSINRFWCTLCKKKSLIKYFIGNYSIQGGICIIWYT